MRAALAIAGTALLALPAWAEDCTPTPRMPVEQSQAIKRSMLPPGGEMRDFELDHIVSLALCGSNDRANLCLQPWPEAREKDRLEFELIRRYRIGTMGLQQAQTMLSHNWRESYRQIFGEPAYAAERGAAQRVAQGGHPSLKCDY